MNGPLPLSKYRLAYFREVSPKVLTLTRILAYDVLPMDTIDCMLDTLEDDQQVSILRLQEVNVGPFVVPNHYQQIFHISRI